MSAKHAAAALAAIAAACGEGGHSATPPGLPAPSTKASVRLLDPGRPPLRPLRYAPAGTTPSSLTLSLRETVRQPGSATTRVRTDETELLGIGAATAEPAEHEGARVALEISDLHGGGPVPGGEAALSPAAGTAEGDAAELEGRAEQILAHGLLWALPLPEEAVGEGARWELTCSFDTERVRLALGAVAEVVAMDPAGARVRVRGILRGEPQNVGVPGFLDVTTTYEVLSAEGTLDGEWLVDPARVLADARFTLRLDARIRQHAKAGASEAERQHVRVMEVVVQRSAR